MERPFAESRLALDNEEHQGPETRKTAQWAASMSRRTGVDRKIWRSDPPRQPALSSSRKRRFSTTRSYVACVLPLCGGLSSPKGKSCPQSSPPRRRSPRSHHLADLRPNPPCPSPCP